MMRSVLPALLLVTILLLPGAAAARQTDPVPATLTLDEAIQIALANNHALRSLRLDIDNADALVREGWGQLVPQVDINSTYTRNVKSVNPFSGSAAGGLFQSLGYLDWLAFNEQARTDPDPGTAPISLTEYFLRRQAGLDAAGVPASDPDDNPFRIPNVYRNGLTVTQKLFDGRAILGATGAQRWLKPLSERGVEREEQLLVDRVRRAFYGSLLAKERAAVVAQSVSRARATLEEVSRQVAEGVAPKFQRLSAEVELANLETQLVQAGNDAEAGLDDLKLLLGIPSEQRVALRGALEAENPDPAVRADAPTSVAVALARRPDLEQSMISIELEHIQLKVAQSAYLPEISAFANVGLVGNVPDNRLSVISDPTDPFRFSTREYGYFADPYWNWDVNVGFQLRWTLFDGLQTHRRIQQRRIALDKAKINRELLAQSITIEVDRALRDLVAARRRLASQERNVERAALNYEYAEARLKEGVASPLEVREASSQLDQSRLNHLQAIHDLLVARSAYETAVGTPASGNNP